MRALPAIRSVASASVMLSGVVHLELWAQGFSGLAVVGPAFLVNAVAGIAIGIALQVSPHWLPLAAAAGFGAATLAAFVLSTTVGFFGVHEQWQGAAVWLSAVSEALAVLLGTAGTWLTLSGRARADGGRPPARAVRG